MISLSRVLGNSKFIADIIVNTIDSHKRLSAGAHANNNKTNVDQSFLLKTIIKLIHPFDSLLASGSLFISSQFISLKILSLMVFKYFGLYLLCSRRKNTTIIPIIKYNNLTINNLVI